MESRFRAATADTWIGLARERHRLNQEGEAVLGPMGWRLLRSFGKLMDGHYAGLYVSALPTLEVLTLLQALQRGERVPVHLMHRHRSKNTEASALSLSEGRLWMHYPDHTEAAV